MGLLEDIFGSTTYDMVKDQPTKVTKNPSKLSKAIQRLMGIFEGLKPPLINPQPQEQAQAAQSAPVPTMTPMPMPTPRPTPVPDPYEARTMPTFDQYQIPREVAYGIANAEGGRLGDNNAFNIGAYDPPANTRASAVDYTSIEQAATAAAKLLSGKFRRADNTVDTRYKEAYAQRADPVEMLRQIMLAGFAGDPNTWKERSKSQGGAGQTYDSWDQFVKDTQGWKKWNGNY